jgi:hypothetical protein
MTRFTTLTAGRRAVIYRHIRVFGRPLVIVQRERPTVFLCISAPRGERPDLPLRCKVEVSVGEILG